MPLSFERQRSVPAGSANIPTAATTSIWAFPVAVWFATRFTLLLCSWIGMSIEANLVRPITTAPQYQALPLLEPFCRWDCEWYLSIAQNGYANGPQTNFFPLLPLLARALAFVTRIPTQWTLLIVSNAACLASYGVLYRMFRRLGDEGSARWGVVLFAAYPFAFFHAAGHPESLMVLLSALAVDYATRGQHGRAGLALAFAVLARHISMLAGLALIVAQVQERPSAGRFFKSPAWLALALPWLSLGGYCLYQKLVWGDPLAFYKARELWGHWAYWGITNHVEVLASPDRGFRLITTYLPFAALVGFGVLLTARRRAWWPPAAFGIALSVLTWSIGLTALGRYSASCWPAFLGWGAVAARRPTFGLLLAVSLALFQGLFFFIFIHHYPLM